jgi:hypothetical protein
MSKGYQTTVRNPHPRLKFVSLGPAKMSPCQKGSKWSASGARPWETEVRGPMSEVRFDRILAASDPAAAGVPRPRRFRDFCITLISSDRTGWLGKSSVRTKSDQNNSQVANTKLGRSQSR